MNPPGSPGLAIVFAKPPRPGQVKTRLAAAVGDRGAAELARAFVKDTWALISALPWARPVLATTESSPGEFGLPHGTEVWLQGDGDLGQRLERILVRALAASNFAVVVGADSPGLPERLLAQARRSLETCDAVLGPCEDGGFYLVGLRRCTPDLFGDLPWSQRTTFERTRERLEARGFTVGVLDPWFDVDRLADLLHLKKLLAGGTVRSPETARVLATLDPRLGGSPAAR